MEPKQPVKLEMQRQAPAVAMALGVLTLAAVVVQFYQQMTPQERYWLRLDLTSSLQRTASRVARAAWRQGHEGMAAELRGRRPEMAARYGRALWLSACRDGLARLVREVKP